MIIKFVVYIKGFLLSIFYSLIYPISLNMDTFRSSLNGLVIITNGKAKIGKRFKSRGLRINVTGGNLSIGDDVFFNNNSSVNCKHKVTIDSGCLFGENVLIYDHNHTISDKHITLHDKYDCEEVTIGKNVWIGSGTIILKGVTIGDNSVVAAGSVVAKSICSNMIYIKK
ncbi:Galactoside O-acetyltransferase [Vibrio coralliirubri]|uniref:acyltransferase n=1 Tax=Vibrio coralliirubri TaxID=1516159 RepID=UPI000637668F|nr:acyltransferase [Vibrio coralliirubri]CDT88170.1 Galactoside O-acetyltransferase [Vibrio coralliirubri]